MQDYYSTREYAERIKDLFSPISTYYSLLNKSKRYSDEETEILDKSKVLAEENHEKILIFIKCLPIEADKYLLLLIYHEVYEEMFNLISEEEYDYYYLIQKFLELLFII